MAMITRQSLVLRGVSVLADGKAKVRSGSDYQGRHQALALLPMRHPSPGCRLTFMPTRQRPNHADSNGADGAAERAGRSESLAGVLARQARGMRSASFESGRPQAFGAWPPTTGSPSLPCAIWARKPSRAELVCLNQTSRTPAAASTRG